jgi:hypothetical protein
MPGQKQYLKFEAIVPICGGERGAHFKATGLIHKAEMPFLTVVSS